MTAFIVLLVAIAGGVWWSFRRARVHAEIAQRSRMRRNAIKVEIVVSSNQDPSRVAQLTKKALMDIQRERSTHPGTGR